MSKKQWYEVNLQTEKIVLIFAEDEEEAKDKAERKVNKNSDKWLASSAWLVDTL